MKHLLFSLLMSSPLLLQAQRASEEFESIFLEDEECALEDLDEEFDVAYDEENSELNEPLSVEITYQKEAGMNVGTSTQTTANRQPDQLPVN